MRTLRIEGLAGAAGAAFGIRDRFTHAHGAALLDRQGWVLDLTLFTAEEHTVKDALAWAGCFIASHEEADRMVLLSAVEENVADVVHEADLETLRRAREVFGEAGVLVVDWILCDGDGIRSLDSACSGQGWRIARSVA